ncbi:Elongation factor-type GTP-binding protein [Phytophthora cinnamomi]|uniref:Elongation factor-type GTP-binding protein n=1 Tax=Phytophthora cinnamomi TaxID=4785 RepID=UPI0035597D61|nr:Elongation factor-type GTP-binding protein [Phytophthora cinnamomi]
MALSPEDEAAYNMLSMKMQRDVNCLADPDRSVRRRAADKLHRALQNEASRVSAAVLRALCTTSLQRPLLQCAESDVVEKCRERALTSLLFLCEHGALEPSDATLKELVALANARLGKLPYPEPTEEIRLLVLQLLHAFLKQLAAVADAPTSLRDVISELANALGKTAVDPFPDAKKMSAECVILISKNWKSDVGMQIGTIVRPMVANLGHQHSRVRVCALQALEAAVPCGSEALPELMKEVLLPTVGKVVFDHAPSVRKQLVITLAAWLAQIEQVQQFEAFIFPIFLAGVVDEAPEVRALSLAKLNELSSIWEGRDEDGGVKSSDMELMEVDMDSANSAPPLFFESRPPLGARKLAASIQTQVLPPLLEKTSDWTVQARERYTQVLSAYLILLEQNMNPFLDKVFAALGKTCRDDEETVFNSVKACSGVVGFYADSQMILASLLPMVAGRLAGQDTAQHRTNGLILLGMSIEGMAAKTIGAHLELIIEALCDAGLRESEVADLQDQLAGVVSSIVKTAGALLAQKDDICFRLFWVLSHLLASSSESSVAYETATEAMGELAAKTEKPVDALYARYMGKLLDTMVLPTDSAASWQKSNPSRVLFDSLCRRGGAACGENLEKIVPVFLVHLEPAQDADVRLAFLALLETMLGTDAISQSFKSFNVSLLQKAIIPNIVWHGGRVAATIRKVAVACAYTLLRQGIADQPCLFETAPQILPVLKSSMDDSDAKTRQLVCLAFQFLFVALPGCLGEEPVHQLYAEILKRLDDSNDTVRKAACQTFATFLKAAPKEHFQGTIIDYTLDCLFVHLDDSEPEIQEAVFEVLKETVAIDAPRLAKKAEENRSRHQSPRYCDQLLELATAGSS